MSPRPSPGPWKDGIRKAANGTWECKYAQRWSRGHRTRKEAQIARGELMAASKAPRRTKDETVKQFAARWTVDFPRQSESTNDWNAERISKFVTEHGGKPMRDITPVMAERFARENPSRLASVKAMFADAQRDRVIDSNPFQNARKPRQDGRKHIIPLTRQEVETLARIAGELFDGYGQDVYGPLITLAAWTGARPAELFGLEWRDVDGDTLHIRRQWVSGELKPHTKGYSKRRVPLSTQALEALARVPRIEGQPYVFFTNTTRARLSQHSHSYFWRQVRDEFTKRLPESHWLRQRIQDGGRRLELYELRHMAASELDRQGVPLKHIARFLGHKDEGELARTTYIHRSEEDAIEAVRNVWREAS
jgi:integrase